MLRWFTVSDKNIFGMTVKMYRNPFVAKKTFISTFHDIEFDHQAYKYFGSELFMYRVLDVNFEQYIEERGDLSRIKDVLIPSEEDTQGAIL